MELNKLCMTSHIPRISLTNKAVALQDTKVTSTVDHARDQQNVTPLVGGGTTKNASQTLQKSLLKHPRNQARTHDNKQYAQTYSTLASQLPSTQEKGQRPKLNQRRTTLFEQRLQLIKSRTNSLTQSHLGNQTSNAPTQTKTPTTNSFSPNKHRQQ